MTNTTTTEISAAEFLAIWEAELAEAVAAGVTARIVRATTMVIRAQARKDGKRIVAEG